MTLGNKTALDLATPYAERLEGMSDTAIFVGSVGLLVGSYVFGLSLLSATEASSRSVERRKSWIITLFSSLVMSVTGLYFAVRLYVTKGDILVPEALLGGAGSNGQRQDQILEDTVDATMANAICIFFLAYCVVDMVFCAVRLQPFPPPPPPSLELS